MKEITEFFNNICVWASNCWDFLFNAVSALWMHSLNFVYETTTSLYSISQPVHKEFIFVIIYFVAIAFFARNLVQPKRKKIDTSKNADVLNMPTVDFSSRMDRPTFFLKPQNLLLVSLVTLLAIEVINILSFYAFGLSVDDVSKSANRIAVAAAAVSILFPVALLIIDNKGDDGLGTVSKSHTLLSYSWALPLGIILLSALGRFSFELHPFAGGLLAICSVGIAAWVFYRLIIIVLYPKIRKECEEKVIKDQAFRSVARSAEDRAGMSITYNFFQEYKDLGIEYSPFSFKDEHFHRLLIVNAHRHGVIGQINIKALTQIFNKILSIVSTANANLSTQKDDNEEQKNKHKFPVKFCLRVHCGKEIDINSSLVEVFLSDEVPQEKRNKLNINSLEKTILACFQIESIIHQSLIINQFEEFCNALRINALNAAKENNVNQLESLERYLGAWLEALTDAFDELNVKYNLSSAAGESSSFFLNPDSEWQPLKQTLDIIEESGSRSLKYDKSDCPEFAAGIMDLTYSLFMKMIRRTEFLSARQLLWASLRLCWEANRTKHPGFNWLTESIIRKFESFSKYSIAPKLEDELKPDSDKEVSLEPVRMLYQMIQEYLRCMLFAKNIELYAKFFRFVMRHPELYRYEEIDHNIEMLEMFAKHSDLDLASKKKLKNLLAKKAVIEKIEKWQNELAVGQGALILMAKANEARDIAITKEETSKFLQILTPHLPPKLKDALTTIILILKNNKEEKWGWDRWEYIPTVDEEAGAKFMQFNIFLENYFSLLLINAAKHDKTPTDISEDLLSKDLKYQFDKGDHSFRKRLDTNLALALETGMIDESQTPEIKSRIEQYLDKYVERTENQWKQILVKTPLDDEIIKTIPIDFDNSFISSARIRPQITFIQQSEANENKISDKKWGSHKLYQRELFVKESGIHFASSFGKEYGSGFARSEDEFIFSRILELCPPVKELSLAECAQKAIDLNLSLDNCFILISRDPEFMRSLSQNNQFEPLYRTPKDILEKYPIRPEGFFLYEGKRIPAYQLFMRDKDSKHGIIITNRESIILRQTLNKNDKASTVMEKSGISFKLRDPLINEEFRKQLIAEKRDWLQNLPEKEQITMAPYYIGISFLQIIDVEIAENAKIVTAKLEKEDVES